MTDEQIAAVAHEDAPKLIYARFVELEPGVLHIRKWSKNRPFDGATLYARLGNGSPPGPFDADENYPAAMLPMALRHVAQSLWAECEPYVIEDMVRIVTQAADFIESLPPEPSRD